MNKKKYVYTYNKKCEVCKKDFETQRYGTKICSDECVKIRLSQNKKYTQEQIDLAIALRIKGVVIPEIVKQTGIKKPSLQKIFQQNEIKLSENAKKEAASRRWIDHNPVVEGKKECSKCGLLKSLQEFHKNNNRITGAVSACKECYKIYYSDNREDIINRSTEYRISNPDKKREMNQNYYENNKEYCIENASRWAAENPEKRKSIEKKYAQKTKKEKVGRTANYRARKRQAMPKWLSKEQNEEIKQIYRNRPLGYCVDHIVPIGGENVCGLHVPWNMQYLQEYQNESKGNKFIDKLLEIGECHQYKRKLETRIEDIDNGMPIESEIHDFTFALEEFGSEHREFVERYEWLGTVSYAPKWVFAARTEGVLGGIIIIEEPNGYTNKKEGKKLEAQIARGATASWTPKNLSSKLLMYSCNWMVKNTTKRLFFGYSDHEAGEIGTIYQACNFMYLGNYFGAKVRYKLESGRLVVGRHFRKTSTFKRYAKELGIKWEKDWTKENGYKNTNAIPKDIHYILTKKGKVHQQQCEQIIQKPKGKYVLLCGLDRRDKKTVSSIYKSVFGEPIPYPKRRTNL